MTLQIIEGNLLTLAEEGQFDVIVHGCNCFHAMKSGIAGQIAKKFPAAVAADKATAYGSKDKLGKWSDALVSGNGRGFFFIINAYTQHTYSRDKDVFEYEAFDTLLNLLCGYTGRLANEFPSPIRIGFPKIGCGLAGGDEALIVAKLERFAKAVKPWGVVTLVEYAGA